MHAVRFITFIVVLAKLPSNNVALLLLTPS